MHRLITSHLNHESLLINSVNSKNVYVFSYLIRILKNTSTDGIDFEEVLKRAFDICTNSSNHKISSIFIQFLIDIEQIHPYIDFIHESIFQIGNVELIKSVMNTPHFNAEYACEDSDSCFSKIVDSKNEDLVLMMLTKYERDVNSVNKDGTALVIKAVENDTPQISSLFIQRSCDMTVKTPTGETLLQMCIEKRWYLHVTYILANGYTALNNDEHYFHHMCHLSIINDSTLIFDKLIKHYFSTKLQRAWRRRMQQSTISH